MLIFDCIKKVNFTEEYLKNSKYMKIFSKLSEETTCLNENSKAIAMEIFQAWNKKLNASKYLGVDVHSTVTSGSSGTANKQASLATNVEACLSKKENLNLFSVKDKPTGVALSSSKDSFNQRPISVDEIIKEKKRKLLLLEQQDGNNEARDGSSFSQSKKRVTFAPDESLVQIRYFVPDHQLLSQSRGKDSYFESEKQEASFAFKKNEITMEPQIIWKQPKGNDFPLSFAFICFAVEIVIPLECSQSSGNKKFTAEAKFQEERERSVLSVTYYNILHVPFSPAEPIDNSQTLVPDGIIPVIPLYEIQQQPSTNQLPVISFDSTALTSLLHNPDLLKVLSSFKNK